jgi:hypothetical protein
MIESNEELEDNLKEIKVIGAVAGHQDVWSPGGRKPVF